MEQALVPFHSDVIETYYDGSDSQCYDERRGFFVPRHMCENIGLAWQAQHAALQDNPILGPELLRNDIMTQGQRRETLLLPLCRLEGWLFGIQSNRIKNTIVRDKLVLYQRECYQALHDYWQHRAQPISAVDKWTIIGMVASGLVEVREEVQAHGSALQQLLLWKEDVDQAVARVPSLETKIALVDQNQMRFEKETLRHRKRVRLYHDEVEFPDYVKANAWEIWGCDDCMMCGRPNIRAQRMAHHDHFIPRAKSGTNTLDNIGLLCRGCNEEKKDKIVAEYRPTWFLQAVNKRLAQWAVEDERQRGNKSVWLDLTKEQRMATLDATVGGPVSNAYVTVSAATALLDARLPGEPWQEADATAQAQALMWATQLLDEQVLWYGQPATMTQALAWPQTGQIDHLGRSIPATVIPPVIQRATATYALTLLGESAQATSLNASTSVADTGLVKSRKVGDTEITYFDPRQTTTPTPSAAPAQQGIPAEVRAMLRPYGHMAGSLTVRLLRT